MDYGEFEGVIGLEVHAQLLTESKLFCGCSTKFGAEPNAHTCPVCMGLPGALPVLNKKAVNYAIKLGLALNCTVNRKSIFARKNYYYPDLPKGYQISQYEEPICVNGHIYITTGNGKKKIRIRRIHLEEDAGKLIHEGTIETSSYTLVDFNRASIPLLEIVSEPDISTPREAVEYLKLLRSTLVYLEICDGNMEEGSLRCDANISVRKKGDTKFGTRTELKNLNSFRYIEKALDYEIRRQIETIKKGQQIIQETRLFNPDQGITYSMRGKEEAHDYRYFPDPDLLPLIVDEEWIETIKVTLPELPSEKMERFVQQYNLPQYDVEILCSEKELANYFEETVKLYPEPKAVSNWIMTEFLRELKETDVPIEKVKFRPQHLAELLYLIKDGKISIKIAKDMFPELFRKGISPKKYVEEKNILQISDESLIKQAVEKVILGHPKEVEEYKKGKEKLFGFFVGQVMKETKGRANPKLVNDILREKLKKQSE
ncbi:MAG: Asp-tRNA(Asn)/Glu-tRNA(Gln) amidotransferase subunit GatB [Deltaproteobacteria bacterium]|nr:Asp-tRNA(Asn)/Glu-tRNA(Gln) amidotransferase subunit GatB [Deltaproteobacteria bacterium]